MNPSVSSVADPYKERGSLSDFSDYESSDEEVHNRAATSASKGRRAYVNVSDDPDTDDAGPVARGKGGASGGVRRGALVDVEDPFADPFAG